VVVAQCRGGLAVAALGSRRAPSCRASIIEFYYKNDALNDPMVSEETSRLRLGHPQEIDDIMRSPSGQRFLSGRSSASASAWSTSRWNRPAVGETR